MRKDICAVLLLFFLALCAAANIKIIDGISENTAYELKESKNALDAGNSRAALEHLELASDIWQQAYSYTKIFLRHSDADDTADCFYELKGLLLDDSKSASAYYEKLLCRLKAISETEHPHPESIF